MHSSVQKEQRTILEFENWSTFTDSKYANILQYNIAYENMFESSLDFKQWIYWIHFDASDFQFSGTTPSSESKFSCLHA